jgi:hypothetical protein
MRDTGRRNAGVGGLLELRLKGRDGPVKVDLVTDCIEYMLTAP